MISIVLPTYNGASYLEKSVSSILNQTYHDFELIIVDDCSTDQTWDLLKKFQQQDQRIQILHNDTNRKLPASLNIGFAVAKGDYYTWTSDDNLYKPDAFKTMVDVLDQEKQVDIVYALFDIINDHDVIMRSVTAEQCEINQIYDHNPVGACFLYRNSVHKKLNGYDENRFLVEDYDFWLRAYRHFSYRMIPESLYSYREHPKSLTSEHAQTISDATVRRIIEEIQNDHYENDFCIACKKIIPYLFAQKDFAGVQRYLRKLKVISETDYKTFPYKIRWGVHGNLAMLCGKIIDKYWK